MNDDKQCRGKWGDSASPRKLAVGQWDTKIRTASYSTLYTRIEPRMTVIERVHVRTSPYLVRMRALVFTAIRWSDRLRLARELTQNDQPGWATYHRTLCFSLGLFSLFFSYLTLLSVVVIALFFMSTFFFHLVTRASRASKKSKIHNLLMPPLYLTRECLASPASRRCRGDY